MFTYVSACVVFARLLVCFLFVSWFLLRAYFLLAPFDGSLSVRFSPLGGRFSSGFGTTSDDFDRTPSLHKLGKIRRGVYVCSSCVLRFKTTTSTDRHPAHTESRLILHRSMK